MEELTLITEEREYEPETTKPGMPQTEEAWKKVEEERIAWEEAEKITEEHPETTAESNPEIEVLHCPKCGSKRVRYSVIKQAFICESCGFESKDRNLFVKERSNPGEPHSNPKEPWQMTKEEWLDWFQVYYVSPQDIRGGETRRQLAEGALGVRRNQVKLALEEGKPVPPEVLADYPDLATSNPSEATTVQCPICGEVIEIPGYDSITRSDALERHIKDKHPTKSNPGEPQGSNFHSLMLHAVAEMYGPGGIVVDEVKARATSCECVEYKPAKYIAVDNAFNRANYPEEIGKVYDSPPSYVAVEKVEGKFWCTSKGVVGALTDEQERIYCNPREMVERPGVKERMIKWVEAVDICRAQLPPTDGRTRLEVYLNCMSKELTKAGEET